MKLILKPVSLFTGLFFVVFVVTTSAQDLDRTQFPTKQELPAAKQNRFSTLDILAGAGIISLRLGPPDPYQENSVDLGYSFGVTKKYLFSSRFGLEGKILYERKGGKEYQDEQTGDTVTQLPVVHKGAITYKHIYNCITVPVMICYSFGRKVKYQIKAGPYYSFLVNAKNNVKSSVTPSLNYSFDNTNLLNNDFGISFGFGTSLPITIKTKLSINAVYSGGLLNIAKTVNPSAPLEWKTNSLLILVGVPLQSVLDKQKR